MRVLIADDEPLALRRLETGMLCIPEAELIGAAKSGLEALALIRELKADVAILDINMPGLDGVGVVERLREDERVPEVIFATAFDKHALRAFELCAVDYLSKPVPFERLRDALAKAQQRLAARDARERFAELQAFITVLEAERSGGAFQDSIWVRTSDSMARLSSEDIICIKALGDYVEIVTEGDVHTLRDSISAMAERLDGRFFVRCHRSSIVNTRKVRAVRRAAGGKFSLHLNDGSSLPIGPNYADAVLEAIKGKRWRWPRNI